MSRPIWSKPLFLEGMYQSLTYGAGARGGVTDEIRDTEIVIETRSLAKRLFGRVAVQELAPRIARDGGHVALGKVRTLLWLTSDPVHDLAADGSSLVVIWFHDGADLRPSELIERLLPELRWEELAEDWKF